MPAKKSFLDRFIEKVEDIDPGSRQAYILRLLRERGFLETVFDVISEGVLVVDSKLRIRYFNRAAAEILALPEDLSNVRLSRLLPSLDWRGLIGEDPECWAKSAKQEIEILYPERKFLRFYLVPLPDEPGLAAVLLSDISSLRLQAMAEAEAGADKAVSMLGAEVAHEIGNPLNSLYLNLQLLSGSDSGEIELDEKERREMLDACRREVERLDNIIKRFLQVVRQDKSDFTLVDVRKLVVETLSFMKSELEDRRIVVNCAWPEDLPRISGSPDALKQMIYNIMRNALQAMQSGGKMDIVCAATPEFLTLEFHDSGVGLNGEQMREMFRPYRTFKPGGHGIGMMMIERVCREHGAEFGISSDGDTGCTVSVRFPLAGRIRRVLGEGREKNGGKEG